MRALGGSLGERAAAAFAAGCDIALYCAGDLAEMHQVADVAPIMEGDRARRSDMALERRARADTADEAELRAEFASLTGHDVSLVAA